MANTGVQYRCQSNATGACRSVIVKKRQKPARLILEGRLIDADGRYALS
jgi:hypothetical protein